MKPGLRELARGIAAEEGLTLEQLKERRRVERIIHARQRVMAELYATGRFSTTKIGQFFERDHTTVLHNIDQYEARTGNTVPRKPRGPKPFEAA